MLFDFSNSEVKGCAILVLPDWVAPNDYRALLGAFWLPDEKMIELHLLFLKIKIG